MINDKQPWYCPGNFPYEKFHAIMHGSPEKHWDCPLLAHAWDCPMCFYAMHEDLGAFRVWLLCPEKQLEIQQCQGKWSWG